MPETHENRDFDNGDFDWERLRKRARKAVDSELSSITAGLPSEEPLDHYKFDDIHVTRMPPDEQAIVRISVGAGTVGDSRHVRYCVFRGDPAVCASLLDEARRAILQEE